MRKTIFATLLAAASMAAPVPALAWDYPGHRIIGAIADMVLRQYHEKAYRRVHDLLDRKGLDNESAANDYLDRCGDFWMGRPIVQRWLDGILHHPTVDADLRRHVRHVKELAASDLTSGARARIEGENTTLRSPARLAATDRTVAADVLAQVFTLAPLPSAK